jgi:hypothetical protein
MSFTPKDEAKYLADRYPARLKAEEMERRLQQIPIRERLEIGRKANQGESLVELVTKWESEHQ